MIYNRFNREISCHYVTASLHHRITASLCQSVICLVPCHQTSQSFALPPATKPVSHLPCPLPPNQSVICFAPCHQASQSFALPPTTTSLHHHITASPCHCISQSFALPPATKPVSHLPCPLPPNQSVICLAPYHCITASLCHRITASPHHYVTVSLHHRITTSPCHRITASLC